MELRYNKYKKTLLSLDEGEEFCKTCNGDGIISSKRSYPTLNIRTGNPLVCKDCLGDGKIDWIEKATGKRPQIPFINMTIERTKLVPRVRKLKR